MFARITHSVLMIAVLLAAVCFSSKSSAEPESAPPAVSAPPALLPITETGPRLEGARRDRRPWALAADAAALLSPCPSWAETCGEQSGGALRLLLLSRPTPGFAWGPALLLSSSGSRFASRGLEQQLDSQARGGLLTGRVWFSDHGAFDPYLEAGMGLGQVTRSGRVTAADGRSEVHRDARLVPVYAASFGADVHVTEQLRLGGFLGFRQWLWSPAEQCAEAFGVCSLPTPAFFSMDAGVWNVGLSVSAVFGRPH